MNNVERFNLRVYGLLIKNGCVLVTDEHRGGVEMTKFPGGGLEKGEGLADCLIREFQEELNVDIRPGDLFYVNDFLQVSAFSSKDQLISFYYIVEITLEQLDRIVVIDKKTSIDPGEQVFRWVALKDLDSNDFTFPIDKVVCEQLCK